MEVARRDLLGVPIALTDYSGAMDTMDGMIARNDRGYVCAVPVHGVMVAQHDPELLRSLTVPTCSMFPTGSRLCGRSTCSARTCRIVSMAPS